ncbi:MAG: diacylglycerol/lipid kinase family protein [Caulobacterales bacterium]|uniref:diacylglycerol/lipid kinase family protein n=1 Tax=Glycocaulis sp. TaxID=1969725 RepID=UPI003FA19618
MTDISTARPETAGGHAITRVSVVLNPNGGSVPAEGREILQALLDDMGVEARFEIIDHDCEDACKRARDHGSQAIIVWGGDGTAACAMNTLGPDDPPVLPLPGGTMNMLHKFVHGSDIDPGTCLEAVLKNPVEMTIPAGEVEGHRFYVGALLGGLTRLAAPREALRKSELLQAVTEFGEANAFGLDTPMRCLSDTGKTHEAQAIGIFLSEDPQKPGFDILTTAPEGLLDLAYTGLTVLLADWRNAWGVERDFARRVDVEALESTGIEATLDGEPVTLARSARFALIPKAARVLTARKE